MLRPGSLPRAGLRPTSVQTDGSCKSLVLPLPLAPAPAPVGHRPTGPNGLRCRAARRPAPDDDIEDMTVDQRLERLSQLSGRVGELRSVFDRQSLLRQMGALDPALYAQPPPAAEEGEEDEEDANAALEWIDWNDDPRTHNVNNTVAEQLPDGLRQRLVLGRDAEEDEAVISAPLHNCLAVYLCEGLEVQDSLERQEAAADFSRMQLAFLERWALFHGPPPGPFVDLLCDFSLDAPPARAKMALWVLWLAEGSGSAYWKETLGALTQPQDMPNPEFCTDEELEELQWMPYALPISVRREALRSFWEAFGASPLAEAMGFRRTSDVDPLAGADGDEEEDDDDDEEEKAKRKAAREAAAAAASGAPQKAEELRPLPPFERFLWAYCHAEAHSLGNGERVVFFPQADPCLYTTEPTSVNTTLAVVTQDGPVLDDFAVLATLRPLQQGEVLRASAPFGEGATEGGGGATSQLHTQFGMVPESGGNEADFQDLEPETGSLTDDWLKRLLGQEAATRLDLITDPRLRHLLALAETGDADMNQMPPLRNILPPLQLPKLWGPGLVAGVRRIRLDERHIQPDQLEREAILASLAEEEHTAEAMAAARRAAGFTAAGGTYGLSYKELDEWRRDLTTVEVVEIPGDPKILETAEGRAEWRRMRAAWSSLPRVTPDNKEHGRLMDAALQGAPLEQVFSSPRDITRELAAAESVLTALNTVLAAFPTSIEQDEQLMAAASAATESPRGKGRRGGGKRRSGSGSDSDADAAAPAPVDQQQPRQPLTAVTSARMLGVVAWRHELKCVWRQMAGMVGEYRDGLAVAEAAVAGAAGAAASEPVAA